MAAQYASMEEAEADAKEYIETTVKKAFDQFTTDRGHGRALQSRGSSALRAGRRLVPFIVSGAII